VTTSREIALAVLLRVEEGAYSNLLLPKLLRESDLDVRDRSYATELVYGSLREQRALDYLLGQLTDRPLVKLDPPVRAALRLGVYQLAHGVPAHAAVSETVEIAPAGARGYVNGVLRTLTRLGPPWPWPEGSDPQAIAVRLSYPDWIVERLVSDFGMDDARATLLVGNEAPTVGLRVNEEKATPEDVMRELRAAGADVTRGALVEDALLVRGAGDPSRVAAVAEGRATPQDEASQAVVAVLDPQPGETVVDVAAAPGGKATAIGERVGERGRVVSGDVHPRRIGLVTRARNRLGLQNVFPVVADGRVPAVLPGCADRVLVDAPCSGLGVLRRRAELRWRIRRDDLPRLVELQRDLLRAVAGVVKPGGVVVYSVCTLTGDETTGVDAWAERELPQLVAEPPPDAPWRPRGRGALVLPHDADTDGMYVLRLRRT
jgi:16S rRNA (cytosine967-C5)-methyltransferase